MAERTIFEGRVVTMNARSHVHAPGRVYVEGTTIVAVRPAANPAPAYVSLTGIPACFCHCTPRRCHGFVELQPLAAAGDGVEAGG